MTIGRGAYLEDLAAAGLALAARRQVDREDLPELLSDHIHVDQIFNYDLTEQFAPRGPRRRIEHVKSRMEMCSLLDRAGII
jgi:hypothetical protein